MPDPAALLDRITADGSLERLLRAARDEDLGERGDVTTRSIVPPDRTARARVAAREAGVVAGLAVTPAMIDVFGSDLGFVAVVRDGETCARGETLATLSGPLAGILAIERTLLNVAGRLSGIATLTRRFVDAVADVGRPPSICATRKTAPGLRGLDKYAVACGGGAVHRLGLHDAALYKDNHLAHLAPEGLAAALAEAVGVARAEGGLAFVQVEVDTIEQLHAVLGMEAGLVDMVLLDNMPPARLRECVAARDAAAPGVVLEASGGITLETARDVAATGVDRLSVGALTHSARALDVALEVD
jgi:nicotinate-nucleotide pyrophosphorylase (carboxylating)